MAKIGTMQLDKAYSYQGPESHDGKTMERIDLDVKIELQRTDDTALDVSLKSQDGKGSFFFDNDSGRIVDSAVTEKLEMVFKLMDKEIVQGNETSTTMKLVKAEPTGSSATASTRPTSSASAASIRRPVAKSSSALARPTLLASRAVPPKPVRIPSVAPGWAKTDWGDA